MTNVTMRVSPTAALVLPCTVTASDVPGMVSPLAPTLWTKAIAARASDPAGPASNTRARSVRVRSRAAVRSITPVMLSPPSTPHPDSGIDGTRPSPARLFAFEYRRGGGGGFWGPPAGARPPGGPNPRKHGGGGPGGVPDRGPRPPPRGPPRAR